ncbi:hypothetical protein ACFFQW_12955 [Umezawaea endophytica]|uniref:Ig-like domain-containing protein n=1 Tax=Umezawaea endophytica TaxID=1654476 RepID=A0A9X3AFU0_9PSEU|nr:hypothetical protein [Umezawaea endophytica]MCS7478756.1 hypothetical protein [Umezawaea endophytica]
MIKSLRTAAAVLTTAVSALALTALGPTGTASAVVQDVTCTPPSSNTATYNPPLTMTPRDGTLTGTAQYGPCVSVSNPAITSGSSGGTTTVSGRTCLDLLQSGTSAFTITWNTGQTSTISANRTSTIAGGLLVVTNTGTVTSGVFAGSTVVRVITSPATDITLCTLGLGTVSSVYSLITLKIISL